MARYRLERGATGFYDPNAGALPVPEFKAFAAAWHFMARQTGGRVIELTEREYPRNFHTAALTAEGREHVALCHAHLSSVAFVSTRSSSYTEDFEEPPSWSDVLGRFGFTVLSLAQLMVPLPEVDSGGLSDLEWREIRFWKATTLGAVLFNAWD